MNNTSIRRFTVNDVAAGIVLFNPVPDRLAENINAIRSQVSRIILADNGSANYAEIAEKYGDCPDICLIRSEKNLGIAAALNTIASECERSGYPWAVLLDQDSVCPEGMVDTYLKYDLDPETVGIIFPMRIDRNRGDQVPKYSESFEEFPTLPGPITSGSMISVSVWNQLNGFFEPLFIDYVDYDYNIRVLRHGFKIIRANETVLLHELGRFTAHNFKGRVVQTSNHSAFRRYYKARNALYYMYIFKDSTAVRQYKRYQLREIRKILRFEDHKLAKSFAILRGMLEYRSFARKHKDRVL